MAQPLPRRAAEPRRWPWVIGAIPGALALALVVGAPVAGWVVETRVLPRLEDRIGRRIAVHEVRVRWGYVQMEDVVVDGAGAPAPLSARRVRVYFDVAALLTGRVSLPRVVLDRPHFEIVRSDTGDDNITTLLEHLKRARREAAEPDDDRGPRRGPAEVEVLSGSLSAAADALGTVEVARFDALVRRQGEAHLDLHDVDGKLVAGPSARAARVEVRVPIDHGRLAGGPTVRIEGGDVRVWKDFAVSGVRGGLTPSVTASADGIRGRIEIDLEGGYGGVDQILWSARGWADPAARSGELHLVADRFNLGKLAPILADTPIQHPSEAEVDARLDLVYRGDAGDPQHLHDALDFDGSFHLSGLTVFHPKLGPLPVRRLGFDASAKGRFEPKAHALHLDGADVTMRGVHAHLTLDASKLEKLTRKRPPPVAAAPSTPNGASGPPRQPADFPAVSGRLTIDPVPCQTALEALPAELVPHLKGFRLEGTFKSDVHATVDTDHLDDIDIGSTVGIDGCHVVQAPERMQPQRLLADFTHAVEVEPGNWIAFTVGKENPNFVPYADISHHLVNSIMTTEDSNFFQHKGFIGREFKTALKSNLEQGRFAFGASSITMQLVKNVLLSREKTLSRKLQELFLTWYLERNVGKERILEMYFNVIEFGPGIYGIGRAAEHYFGKPAKELAPRQAAFFSSILPNPKKRYVHYCNGPDLDEKWENYLHRILRTMHARGRLTDSEYDAADHAHLVFDRREMMPRDKCLELVRRITAVGPDGTRIGTVGDALPSAANAEVDDPAGADDPTEDPASVPDPVPEL